MRRQDIKVGVEYAATAPLAYGREPHTPPRRVRVTDKRPGPWGRILTLRKTEVRSRVSGKMGNSWVVIETKLVHLESDEGRQADEILPYTIDDAKRLKFGKDEPWDRKTIGGRVQHSTRRVFTESDIPLGSEITVADFGIKGGLPGEVYRHNQETEQREWLPTLVQPADIHRTWAEVEQKDQKDREREAAREASARVPELNAFLQSVGLDRVMRFDTSGSSDTLVQVVLIERRSEDLLVALQEWRDTHIAVGVLPPDEDGT